MSHTYLCVRPRAYTHAQSLGRMSPHTQTCIHMPAAPPGTPAQACTPLHLDMTEADNWAVLIIVGGGRGSGKEGEPVAVWHFVHPLALRHVMDALRARGLATDESIEPADAQFWAEMRASAPAWMEQAGLPGVPGVMQVEQRHNQVVHVPAGWAHQVDTLQPCLKAAWDLWEPRNFVSYLMVQRLAHRVGMTGDIVPKDYQNLQCVMKRAMQDVMYGV